MNVPLLYTMGLWRLSPPIYSNLHLDAVRVTKIDIQCILNSKYGTLTSLILSWRLIGFLPQYHASTNNRNRDTERNAGESCTEITPSNSTAFVFFSKIFVKFPKAPGNDSAHDKLQGNIIRNCFNGGWSELILYRYTGTLTRCGL